MSFVRRSEYLENWFDEYTLEIEPFDELYLIVGAYSDNLISRFDDGEIFRYSYSIEGMEPPPEYVPPEEDLLVFIFAD